MAATTLGETNTVAVGTGAQQLVFPTAGGCYFTLLNTGAGNVFVRLDQAPTGASDPLAFELPATPLIPIRFFVRSGNAGLWVVSGTTANLSVLVDAAGH